MQTANLVGEVRKIGEIGASGTYYDKAAWAQPQGVTFGDTGRNQFYGPGGVNLDMSLFRGFRWARLDGWSSVSTRTT